MADVITRFKLETTQYDSKLRDEAKRLSDFARQASIAGKEFGKFAQSNVEAARAFGNIAVSATNAKDKVKELVGAFNTVAKEYNMLTKEQQQSDFGKALAESMTTLKGRIAEAKQEMNSTGGIMEQLAQKFTINIDATKLFNAGMTAAKAALDVAKDAFFASEASVDEWGRTMKAAQGLYDGFLNAINNGDISGYLSRMDDIVKAAREAYNAMDTLQTMKTIQGPQFAKQEAENNRIRMMIQTGRWISASDGRKSPLGLKDGDLLSPAQIRILERQLQGGMQTIVSLTKNELKQTGVAIDAYYNSLAKQNGMSISEFRQGTSNWGAFREKMAGYEAYKKWDAQARAEFARQGGQGYVNFDKNNPYAEFRKWGTFRVDKMGENSYNELVGLIRQQQQQQSQMYSTMGQAYRTINRAEGVTVKGIMGGSGGSSGGSTGGGLDLSKIAFNPGEVIKPDDFIAVPSVWQEYADGIKGTFDTIGDSMSNLTEWTKNFDPYAEKMKEMTEATKQQQMAFSMAGQAATNFGAALAGLDDPAAKAAGTVISAIANIALGFGQAVAQAGSMGPLAWLAYVAAGTAALATTISTVHSLTGYTNGGEIKGNSYSGDNIPIMANASEIILNRAQQANVAQGLLGSTPGNINLQAVASGEQLWFVMNNHTKRKGWGEIVTWR